MKPSAGRGGEPTTDAASNNERHAATSRGAAVVASVWVLLVLSSAKVKAENAIRRSIRMNGLKGVVNDNCLPLMCANVAGVASRPLLLS